MSSNDRINVLLQFRDMCLRLHPDDVQTMPQAKRDTRLGIASETDRLSGILFAGVRQDTVTDICLLAKTPRLLKLILRRCYRTWEHLHGEIDFDDLLVANTLRFAAPEAFEFLLDNHQEIRGLRLEIMSTRPDRLNAVEHKWSRITELAKWDIVSAKRLAQFLLPCWHDQNSTPPVQGLQVSEPTDYWNRFLAEELEPGVVRDQEVLQSLVGWTKDPTGVVFRNETLPTILCNNEQFSNLFEHFAALVLTGRDIRRIASSMFAEALRLQGPKANSNSVPGFIPLWRRAIRQPIDQPRHTQWVQSEIFKALPESLRFANDLFYYYSHNSEADLHSPEGRTELRSEIVKRSRQVFEGRPDQLLKVLDPDYMYISYHFCVLYSSPEHGGTGFKATDWQWYLDLLLDAAEISPQVIVPQLVSFLIEEHRRILNLSYTFKEDVARELFGSNLSRLMRILSSDIQIEQFELRDRQQIRVAQEAAALWLHHDHAD